MRILLLSQFFWPESRTAPTNLAATAADLNALGHEVLVVTGFPNHPLGRIYDGYVQKIWQQDEYAGVPIIRLPLYPDHSQSAIKRLLNYGTFALTASTIGLFKSLTFRPDVIFTYFAPLTMGITATIYRYFHRAPTVYWITDMWPENLRAVGALKGEKSYKFAKRLELWAYERTTHLCVDSPGYKTNLIDKGVPEEKITVIPEWADEALFFPSQPDSTLAETYGLEGKFNILYGGNIGTAQALHAVIEAGCLISDLPDIQIVFVGDGNALPELKEFVQEYNLSNIRFIPRQPMEDIHRFFALADVLLVHLRRIPMFTQQLPSKIIAYLACGKPILCAVEGAAGDIVLEANAGVVCQSENVEAIAQQMRHMYNMAQTGGLQQLGINARLAHQAKFTRKVSVSAIEQVLLEIAQ